MQAKKKKTKQTPSLLQHSITYQLHLDIILYKHSFTHWYHKTFKKLLPGLVPMYGKAINTQVLHTGWAVLISYQFYYYFFCLTLSVACK